MHYFGVFLGVLIIAILVSLFLRGAIRFVWLNLNDEGRKTTSSDELCFLFLGVLFFISLVVFIVRSFIVVFG